MIGYKEKLCSIHYLLYYTHAITSWGNRMWRFSVGLFLVQMTKSLRLTAIYGFSSSVTILIFGAIIGKWIDRNPRFKVAKLALFFQNGLLSFCATIFAIAFMFSRKYEKFNGPNIDYVLMFLILVSAVLADVAGMVSQIVIGKDWVVIIARENNLNLARLNATLKRIDLLTNILTPLFVGQILNLVSFLTGASIVAGWNIVSMVFEYVLLHKIYYAVPRLAFKTNIAVDELPPQDVAVNGVPLVKRVGDEKKIEEGHDMTTEISKKHDEVKPKGLRKKDGSEIVGKNGKNSEEIISTVEKNDPQVISSSKLYNDLSLKKNGEDFVKEPLIDKSQTKSNDVIKDFQKPEQLKDPNLTSTTDVEQIEIQPKKNNTKKIDFLRQFKDSVDGWKLYMGQKVKYAGFSLALLYLTVIGFDSITVGYAYSLHVSEAVLGCMIALGALTGIIGTFIYPVMKNRYGSITSGIFAIMLQLSCLVFCLVSIWLPGSPWKPGFIFQDLKESFAKSSDLKNSSNEFKLIPKHTFEGVPELDFPHQNHELDVNFNPLNIPDGKERNLSNRRSILAEKTDNFQLYRMERSLKINESKILLKNNKKYLHIGVFLFGIVASRIGLWMIDLTINQIMQESVVESQKGVIMGVQHSLTMIFEIIKYSAVILLPKPQTFGWLVILSFCSICASLICFCKYAYQAKKGHLRLEDSIDDTQNVPICSCFQRKKRDISMNVNNKRPSRQDIPFSKTNSYILLPKCGSSSKKLISPTPRPLNPKSGDYSTPITKERIYVNDGERHVMGNSQLEGILTPVYNTVMTKPFEHSEDGTPMKTNHDLDAKRDYHALKHLGK
ncbi:unnamed protein product [Gordionus sp. m RMFG-2023]